MKKSRKDANSEEKKGISEEKKRGEASVHANEFKNCNF
jgi:hypothetical protein